MNVYMYLSNSSYLIVGRLLFCTKTNDLRRGVYDVTINYLTIKSDTEEESAIKITVLPQSEKKRDEIPC